MAIVMNVSGHAVPLTVGLLAPRATKNVDTSQPLESALIADGTLLILDAEPSPAVPDTLATKAPAFPAVWTDQSPSGADEFVIKRADGTFETSGYAGGIPRKPRTSTNQVNELIEWAVNHGRKYVQLDERNYDNTSSTIVVPPTFRLEGGSFDSTAIFVRAASADAMQQEAYSRVAHLQLHVPAANRVTNPNPGVTPYDGLYGIRTAPKSQTDDVLFVGFHAAVKLEGDHVYIANCETRECAVGMARLGGGTHQTRGNLSTHRNRWQNNSFAGFFVGTAVNEDNWETVSDHFINNPFGLFAHNGGGQNEFGFANIRAFATSFETNGNRHVHLGTRKISGTMFSPSSGPLNNNQPAGAGSILIPDGDWAKRRLQSATGTFGPFAGGIFDQNYVFTSGNVTGKAASGNDNMFSIQGDNYAVDLYNGSFNTPGSTGVFQKLT